MAEKWFYAQSIPEPGEVVVLDAEETRHATRSRHLEIGSEATLFDGRGRTARVRLAEVSRRSATALVLETQQHPVPKPRLHLACALPKGDRVSTLLSMPIRRRAATVPLRGSLRIWGLLFGVLRRPWCLPIGPGRVNLGTMVPETTNGMGRLDRRDRSRG